MIPWEDFEEQGPVPPEQIRKTLPSEKRMKRQVLLDAARRQDYRGCGRKRQYSTRSVAEGVADKSLRKHTESPRPHTYECATCGQWHLTHGRVKR